MNSEQPGEPGEPRAAEERGTPIGRRVLLGTIGLGALGLVAAPPLQRGLEAFLGSAADKDPTGLTGLLPNGGGFRYYSVTSSVPHKDASNYRLTVGGLVDRPASYMLDDLRKMPQTRLVRDIQCVTGWRVPGTPMEGVRLSRLLDAAGVRGTAGAVRVLVPDPFRARHQGRLPADPAPPAADRAPGLADEERGAAHHQGDDEDVREQGDQVADQPPGERAHDEQAQHR